jgi:hypothetical protein
MNTNKYEKISELTRYAPWSADQEFQDAYQKVKGNTLVDIYRCWELWSLVEQVRLVPGVLIEVGVWRGGTAALISRRALDFKVDAPVYLFDTFAGVVKATKNDSTYKGGEHNDTSMEIVQKLIDEVARGNAGIHKGIFPEQMPPLVEEVICMAGIRFCHIDVDTYQSAKDIFDFVWPRLSGSGVIVFDDYGFRTCDGVRKFVDQVKSGDDRFFIYNLNGHAVIIKR